MTPDPDAVDGLEASPRVTVGTAGGAPLLRLGAYEGPLDRLLELARAQTVDLTRLSIRELAEQFAAAVEVAIDARRLPLHRLADWLAMAAWLLLLRSRLLLPADSPAGQVARREAMALRQQLARREAVRRLAAWLARRPQLGRDVFGRGAAEPDAAYAAMPAADLTALLRACLAGLQRPGQGGRYRPEPLPLWRLPQALARLRRLLPDLPDGATLEHFLPPPTNVQSDQPLQRRAALASTLLAGLELEREGSAKLEQDAPFGRIRVMPVGRTAP